MMTDPIQIDPQIMHGVPCFSGTRVPVQHLFDYVVANHPIDEFLEDFPTVTREQVLAVLERASRTVTAGAAA